MSVDEAGNEQGAKAHMHIPLSTQWARVELDPAAKIALRIPGRPGSKARSPDGIALRLWMWGQRMVSSAFATLSPEEAELAAMRERVTILCDICIAVKLRTTAYDTSIALAVVVDKYFPQKAVFDSRRWDGALAQQFWSRGQDPAGQRPYYTVWHELAEPALFSAMHAIPDTTKRRSVERYLRNYMRREIERDLLGGITSDQKEMQIVDAIDADHEARDWDSDGDLTLAQVVTEAHIREREGQDLAERIAGLRALLTPREQAVFDLIRDGMSYSEIAERLGIKEGAVRGRWHRIKRKLEERVNPA